MTDLAALQYLLQAMLAYIGMSIVFCIAVYFVTQEAV